MTDSALDYLLGTYFHQDFFEDYGDEWGALDAFMRLDAHLVSALPDEIDRLLATHPTEDALDDYLNDLGCEYLAGPEDGGYRGWLTEVARRVREATSA